MVRLTLEIIQMAMHHLIKKRMDTAKEMASPLH